MKASRPTPEEVQSALESELSEAFAGQRRPTISNVEKRFNIPHSTFYRRYPNQVQWFRGQLGRQHETAKAPPRSPVSADSDRLRRENADLRNQVRIYAEAIRQLTLKNTALETALQAGATGLTIRLPGRVSRSSQA